MNTIEITGRIVRDLEPVRNKQGEIVKTRLGKTLYTSSVADQHSKKEGDVSFFKFVMYGEPGEQASQQFGKGDLVMIRGWMKQNRWKDSRTGQSRNDWELRVQEIFPVTPKDKHDSGDPERDVPLWIQQQADGVR